MFRLPTVEDPKVKSGGAIFSICKDGEVAGYKESSGYRLPYLEGLLNSRLVYITCPNQVKKGKFSIGFSSEKSKFRKMIDGPMVDISMILVKGLIYDEGTAKVVFHRWKGKGCCDNLQVELIKYKDNANAFIQQFFHAIPEEVDVDNIDITYVNQIQGSRLDEWPQELSVYEVNGNFYYKANTQPDVLCKRDPFSDAKTYNYLQPPKRVKLDGNNLPRVYDDVTATYIGRPKLRRHKTTRIVYGVDQDNTDAMGNFNKPLIVNGKVKVVRPLFQTMPPQPGESDSNVKIAPISKEDRKKLEDTCREAGGFITTGKFRSEMAKYSKKYKGETIDVQKISLNKVSYYIIPYYAYYIIYVIP